MGSVDSQTDQELRSVPPDISHTTHDRREGYFRLEWKLAIDRCHLMDALMSLNRLDEAERAMNEAVELLPTSAPLRSWLAVLEVKRGNPPAALEAVLRAAPGAFRDMSIAFARQIGGGQGEGESALRTLIEKDANQSAYQLAEVFALRNDAKATFEWLDRAWQDRDAGIQYLLFDPFIVRRDDPRFAVFCRKVGLPVPVPGAATAHNST